MSKYNNPGYYMIIERDPMKKLGMIIDTNNENLIWDDVIVPIWRDGDNHPNPTLNRAKIKQVVQQTSDPKVTREATGKIVKCLDSKYEKANLKEISQPAHQLDTKDEVMLLHLIKYF